MIKRSPSLTEQAKTLIKQRIVNDEFDEGRIPSETDLASELGVSRTTIRDALSRLELEGSIIRRQGAGTFVNAAGLQIHIRLEEIWLYEAMLEAHGYTPANRIIAVTEQPAGPDIATALNIAPDTAVTTVKKLFLADGQPVIFTINHIPTRHITTPFNTGDFHQPVIEFLATNCQQELAYYLSEIVPLIATNEVAALLHLPPHKTALLSFEEIGYNTDNDPILKATSCFRDDLLRLRLIRRGSNT